MHSNEMIKRIVYVFFWSVGLLWATFPDLFKGEMDFNFQAMAGVDFFKNYIFPLLMALLLYMFDVIYAFHLENGRGIPTRVIPVYTLTAGFLLFFVLSVACGCAVSAAIFFFLAWACLVGMKFLKTAVQPKPNPVEAREIRED